MTTIFLDLDGVLVDFAGGVCRLMDRPDPDQRSAGKALHQHLGCPSGVMWGKIDQAGARFWEELQPTPWADAVVEWARASGEMVIASSPSISPSSLAGKVSWLQRRFGRRFRDFIFTPHKHLLAAPGRILIDDAVKHVEAFTSAGGQGRLFPTWENAGRQPDRDPWQQLQHAMAGA